MKLVEKIALSLRQAASSNSQTSTAAAAVLWPDKDGHWQAALPQLTAYLPSLMVLGPFDPSHKTGPAIWLKCAVAGALPGFELGGQVPVSYMPGVSRADLRAIEDCPRELLKRVRWNLLARRGEGGVDSPQAAGAFIILLTQTQAPAADGFKLHGIDACLLKLLIAAWETVQPGSWKPAALDKLRADADCVGKGLDVWLRDKFFEQHAKRFHHRPFIWQVWDGLKDGFAALVNYHKLDTKNLERLIHLYLGRWISDQEDGVRNGVDGAPTRLAAAQDLKRRLELILEGEAPHDIFVRWKPLADQPTGWTPDLNDGVRLNIRPFMTAEVLRHSKKPKLNISWDKDRGKDVASAPWFKVFEGERINDHHLTLADKRAARSKG